MCDVRGPLDQLGSGRASSVFSFRRRVDTRERTRCVKFPLEYDRPTRKIGFGRRCLAAVANAAEGLPLSCSCARKPVLPFHVEAVPFGACAVKWVFSIQPCGRKDLLRSINVPLLTTFHGSSVYVNSPYIRYSSERHSLYYALFCALFLKASTQEDLEFLRNQSITVEVNMARLYNYDVLRRRKAEEEKKARGELKTPA